MTTETRPGTSAIATASVPSTLVIERFDPGKGPWTPWLLQFEGALKIFQVPDKDKVHYILHYIGSAAFNVLFSRLSPSNPYETNYDVIKKTLQEYYEPKPQSMAENYKWMTRKQQDGESIMDYVTSLQKLSLNCKLGDALKIVLRNVFVCGIRNKRIQNRLLEAQDVEDFTLEKAVQMASSMELSEKGTRQMQGEETAVVSTSKKKMSTDKSLYKKNTRGNNSNIRGNSNTFKNSSNKENITCFRCGKGHYATACNLDRNIKCLSCGKTGHIRKVCKAKPISTQSSNSIYTKVDNSYSLNNISAVEHKQFRDKIYTTLNVRN